MSQPSPENENPFQSPAPIDSVHAPAATSRTGGSRLGDILGRAFNAYTSQWSAWPLPVFICGLILIGSELACFFPVLFAQGPLMCALFACAMLNLRDQPVDTSALGRGWNVFWSAAWGGIVLLLIQMLPVIFFLIVMVAGMAGFGATVAPRQPGGKPDDAAAALFAFGFMAFYFLFFFGFMAWMFYFNTRTMFVMPLIADRGYGFSDAWHASWEATRRRFWERLLLVVLAGILGGIGVYICYVGVLFTLPLYFLIIGAAYEDEFGIAFEGWRIPSAPPVPPGASPFVTGEAMR